MEDSTNKTQAKTTWKSMLIKKNSISEKVSLSLEMLIGNAKKKKDTFFQKTDWIDIAMLTYPIKNGQICIHRAQG